MAGALTTFEVVQRSDLRIPNMIAITSGKGGVGKTCLSIAFAQALANAGRRVLLVDGDLGLANIDVQLGVTPRVDLGTVLADRNALSEAPFPYLKNLDVVAGRSASGSLGDISERRLTRLLVDLATLASAYDTVVLDTATGVGQSTIAPSLPSGQIVMILTDEPSSLTNAFAVTKRLHSARDDLSFGVLVNFADNFTNGTQTFQAYRNACLSTLGLAPKLIGILPRDDAVPQAIRQQSPILSLFPRACITREIREIAQKSL